MVCIYCGKDTEVSNSRHQKKNNQVWRRRTCKGCRATVTSIESVDLTYSVRFKAKSGRLEPFSRDKLFTSIYKACKHRKQSAEDSTALTATVLTKLHPLIKNATIDRDSLVDITGLILRRFDKTAGTVYLAFHGLETKD